MSSANPQQQASTNSSNQSNNTNNSASVATAPSQNNTNHANSSSNNPLLLSTANTAPANHATSNITNSTPQHQTTMSHEPPSSHLENSNTQLQIANNNSNAVNNNGLLTPNNNNNNNANAVTPQVTPTSNAVAHLNSASTPSGLSSSSANMSGFLLKWTNYIKGYQKRWFILHNGILSYFR
jgi:hypothetical protein